MRPMAAFIRPRFPRRRAVAGGFVGCPRVSPEWDFAAARALIKPQTGRQLTARPAMQAWTEADTAAADATLARVRRLLPHHSLGEPIASAEGEYHLLVLCGGPWGVHEQRALGMALSLACRGRWFVGGGAFVRDGWVYRRERGYKLQLTRLRSYHLPRELRRRLSPVLPVRRRMPPTTP